MPTISELQARVATHIADLRSLDYLLKQPAANIALQNVPEKFIALLDLIEYGRDTGSRIQHVEEAKRLVRKEGSNEHNFAELRCEAVKLQVVNYSKLNKDELKDAVENAKRIYQDRLESNRRNQALSELGGSSNAVDCIQCKEV